MCTTRKLWLLAFLFAAPGLSSAQNAQSGMAWGITGGVGASGDRGGGVPNPYNRTSTMIGAFIDRPVNAMWSIHPELAFSSRGTNYDVPDAPLGDISGSLAIQYLTVPVMLRAVGGTPALRVFGEVGPSLALKAGCSATATQNEASVAATCSDYGKVKAFDAGAALGAGIELPNGTRSVLFGARYTLGETKVFEGANGKSRELEFTAGFTF